MKTDDTTLCIWIGGSCDYGHQERAGAAVAIVEKNGTVIKEDTISDFNTTEFRMMLTLMAKLMNELPADSDILFYTNVAYILNFDRQPTEKSANADLVCLCIEGKKRHRSVSVRLKTYHKSPLLVETHEKAKSLMEQKRCSLTA